MYEIPEDQLCHLGKGEINLLSSESHLAKPSLNLGRWRRKRNMETWTGDH